MKLSDTEKTTIKAKRKRWEEALYEPLTEKEAADFAGMPIKLFRKWSKHMGGPILARGRDQKAYSRADVFSWLATINMATKGRMEQV